MSIVIHPDRSSTVPFHHVSSHLLVQDTHTTTAAHLEHSLAGAVHGVHGAVVGCCICYKYVAVVVAIKPNGKFRNH